MTLTFGHVCIEIVYVHFLESFDVRTKRTDYSKRVSKLVRTELKTLLMHILAGEGSHWTFSKLLSSFKNQFVSKLRKHTSWFQPTKKFSKVKNLLVSKIGPKSNPENMFSKGGRPTAFRKHVL
jgi:hypothetical protein